MPTLRVPRAQCVVSPGVSLRGPKIFPSFPATATAPRHRGSRGRYIAYALHLSGILGLYCSEHKVSLVSRRLLPAESAPFRLLSVLQVRWEKDRSESSNPHLSHSVCVRILQGTTPVFVCFLPALEYHTFYGCAINVAEHFIAIKHEDQRSHPGFGRCEAR